MEKKEIMAAAMRAAKEYGYEWVMADYGYEESDEYLDILRKDMEEKGSHQVCIFGGEEPYYALDRATSDVDLNEVMEDGEVFNEGNVYKWITLGRIEAWKEILEKKSLGWFCDGYRGYVFDPGLISPSSLKYKGEVVVG